MNKGTASNAAILSSISLEDSGKGPTGELSVAILSTVVIHWIVVGLGTTGPGGYGLHSLVCSEYEVWLQR